MRRVILAAIIGLLSPVALAAPASANTIDAFTIAPSASPAGSAITVTATWTATSNLGDSREIAIVLPTELVGQASWAAVRQTPAATDRCVPDATEAACLWRPSLDGTTVTVTATLDVSTAAPPGAYALTARSIFPPEPGTLLEQTATLTILSAAAPSIALTPTSATPGSSSTATGTFTAMTSGDIIVLVDLQGTGGNGTLGSPVVASGLENCVLNGTSREYRCTWKNAMIGETRTIQIPIVVGSGATPGQSWTVSACANPSTEAQACATTYVGHRRPGIPVAFADCDRHGHCDRHGDRDPQGTTHAYAVSAVATSRKAALPHAELFAQTGPERVVLVTCGGTYDREGGGWDSNVVVTFTPVAGDD